MAYDISIAAPFSNTGGNVYQLFLYVRRDQTDVANSRSSYAWQLQCRFVSGTNQRYNLSAITFGVTVHTQSFYPVHNLDMRGVSALTLGSGTTDWFSHDSLGVFHTSVRTWANNVDIFGSADTGNVPFYTDDIPRPPSPPSSLAASAITDTSARLNFTKNQVGYATIDNTEVQYSTSSTFASNVSSVQAGTATFVNIAALQPGVKYYWRARSSSAGGISGWSGTASFTTSARVPSKPGTPMTSAVSASGMTVSWSSAAGNGSAVTTYQLQIASDSSFTTDLRTIDAGLDLTEVISGLSPATTYYLRVRALNSVGWGPWSSTKTQATVATTPSEPRNVTASNPTSVSVDVSWDAPATTGGSDITGYDLAYSTSSTFASNVETLSLNTSRSTSVTGLNPGTTYYFLVRAKNGVGAGPWSTAVSQATTVAVPPGMTVVASADGRSATVGLTPPGGITGVSKYTIQFRDGSSGSATTIDTTSVSYTRTGLTPGTTYQWRTSAWYGNYQTPWTSWTSLTQPNPQISPGEYFDGSSAATADLLFAWAGTAHGSISYARSLAVQGWGTGAYSSAGPTTVAGPARITGGKFGAYAARSLILADATGPGVRLGQSTSTAYRTSVQPNTPYVASIYARPSRPQRMRARVDFYTAAGATSGAPIQGPEVMVTDTVNFTRLIASVTTPADAAWAVVCMVDVTGTGWSPWLGGEYFDGDGAMITLASLFDYFDGNTTATPDFSYSWLGPANASVSMRTVLNPGEVNPLDDPDCPPIPVAPQPPQIPAECIDEVGIWRRYIVTIPEGEVRKWTATVPTIILSTGAGDARQVRLRFYENPSGGTVPPEGWDAELIIAYIPPNTELTIDSIARRVWASVNGGATRPAAQLLYGTKGAPATWPEFECGLGQLVTLDVPLESPIGNLTPRILLTQRT